MARQNLRDLRSIYAVLTDILHKNINKVRDLSVWGMQILITVL